MKKLADLALDLMAAAFAILTGVVLVLLISWWMS